MKFRKKPVEVEAIQYTGKNENEVMAWARKQIGHAGVVYGDRSMVIPTLEGDMTAQPFDWIICGVKKELYPCKPDIFKLTYEPV